MITWCCCKCCLLLRLCPGVVVTVCVSLMTYLTWHLRGLNMLITHITPVSPRHDPSSQWEEWSGLRWPIRGQMQRKLTNDKWVWGCISQSEARDITWCPTWEMGVVMTVSVLSFSKYRYLSSVGDGHMCVWSAKWPTLHPLPILLPRDSDLNIKICNKIAEISQSTTHHTCAYLHMA